MSLQNGAKTPRGLKQLYALGQKRSVDLSLSENPLGCSPDVFRVLTESSFAFHDYPKPNGAQLKRAIALKLDCKIEKIFIANGSEAIISAIPRVFARRGNEAIVPQLTFPMFSICSELAGLDVRRAPMTKEMGIDLQAVLELISPQTRIIFLCNPNNPTGATLTQKELIAFLESIPEGILVVVDEANIEFGGESIVRRLPEQPNLIVLRTFSKGFGLANARVGFALADRKLIQKLEEETAVFPTSGLSEQLAAVALQDEVFLAQTKQFMDSQRAVIRQSLEDFGFTVFPSESNNLFVQLPAQLSPEDFWRAMNDADISLVQGSSFSGFDDHFFRVSPRQEPINNAFLSALQSLTSYSKQR